MNKKNDEALPSEADLAEDGIGGTREGQQDLDGVEAESVHQLQVEDSCIAGEADDEEHGDIFAEAEKQNCVIPMKRTRHQANVEVSFSLDLGILVISMSSVFFCKF